MCILTCYQQLIFTHIMRCDGVSWRLELQTNESSIMYNPHIQRKFPYDQIETLKHEIVN